jgi:hypothetical protein
MRIVPQLAAVSYSPLPSIPLLAAPHIAGLLPTNTARQIEIVRDAIPSLDSLWQFIGAFRSRDQMNAEIAALAQSSLESMRRDRRSL